MVLPERPLAFGGHFGEIVFRAFRRQIRFACSYWASIAGALISARISPFFTCAP